jgi:hypothetical protein
MYTSGSKDFHLRKRFTLQLISLCTAEASWGNLIISSIAEKKAN